MTPSSCLVPYFKLSYFLCLSTILSILYIPSTLYAAEPRAEDWHYTLRPGDNLQKISQTLLNRQHTWTDLVQHNQIEQVSALAPGSILRIPMHWLKHQPLPATVKSISGSAQIKRASQAYFKLLKKSAQIRVGDEVATREGSVLIEFADKSTIRLEKQSNLVFNKLSHFGKTGMVDTRLRLIKGSLSTEVTPLVKGSRYEITTPSAVAAVRGTKFRLISKNTETKLEVLEGNVDFSGKYGSKIVAAGQGATIRQDRTSIEINKLPSAPKPLFANKTIEDLPAKLRWEEQKASDEYRFELTDANRNNKRIATSKSSEPELNLTHIQNGDYDIAMRAINQKNYEGINSLSKISVNISSEVAELLAPLDGSIIDTSTPNFVWQFKDPSVLGKLELAKDADFILPVIKFDFSADNKIQLKESLLPGRYFWRVVALADDSEESTSAVRELSIRGVLSPIKILSVNYVASQVGLFWNSVDNAQGYILQISDSKSFENILKEQTLGKAKAHLRLNTDKQYYARVKGIGNDLFTSDFGPTKSLFIKTK